VIRRLLGYALINRVLKLSKNFSVLQVLNIPCSTEYSNDIAAMLEYPSYFNCNVTGVFRAVWDNYYKLLILLLFAYRKSGLYFIHDKI